MYTKLRLSENEDIGQTAHKSKNEKVLSNTAGFLRAAA